MAQKGIREVDAKALLLKNAEVLLLKQEIIKLRLELHKAKQTVNY